MFEKREVRLKGSMKRGSTTQGKEAGNSVALSVHSVGPVKARRTLV